MELNAYNGSSNLKVLAGAGSGGATQSQVTRILKPYIIGGRNILDQDAISYADSIYVIKYDFDLNGKEITIPEGCTLKFEGGSLRNGTLANDKGFVIDSKTKCLDNILFSGKCIGYFMPKLEWWVEKYPINANDISVDNTSEINQCINCGCLNVMFPWNRFLHISKTIVMEYPVNIFTEEHSRTHESVYTGNLYDDYIKPCLFSKEVVTLFDITLRRRTIDGLLRGKYAFIIGNVNLYVDVPFSELTEESINIPIIDIKSAPSDHSQTTRGITLDCNIKANRYYVNLPEEEQTQEGVTTKRMFNYTGIRIDSSEGPISHIRINGELEHLFCGARIYQGKGSTDTADADWMTDITLNGSTYCCYGVRTNCSPLIIHETHEPEHIPPKFRDYEGYFVGSKILYYGYVWDLALQDSSSSWYRARCAFTSTSNSTNQIVMPYTESGEEKIRYMTNNPVQIVKHSTGIEDIQDLPNMLYNGLLNIMPIQNLSYKLQFEDEDNLIESLNTDRIINKHLLFNENSKATIYNANYAPSEYVNQSYTKKPWVAAEISFIFRSTYLNWNSVWAPLYLLIGVTERRASENPTIHLNICTGNSAANIDTTNPIYDEDIAYANIRTFSNYIKVDLDRLGINYFSKITVSIQRKGTNMKALPFISIPNYFGSSTKLIASSAEARPYLNENSKGYQIFDTDVNKELVWDGNKWVFTNGDPIGYNLKIVPQALKYTKVNYNNPTKLLYMESPIGYDLVYTKVSKDSLVRIKGVGSNSYKLYMLLRIDDYQIIDIFDGSYTVQNVPLDVEFVTDEDCILVINVANEGNEIPYRNYANKPYSVEIFTNRDISSNISVGKNKLEDLTPFNVGYTMFNTTLNKPIWWTGSAWVDANGTTV